MRIRYFLSLFATSILALCVGPGYGLQGGPVMPDYVQFEPSDASDVVNLNTGNFSYTLPLSEIPGPYGNFPIDMSYHAGIGPNQEATLVGLGWSLNAGGAINRTLRGTPDDQFHGGDLTFIYAYSSTNVLSVDATLPFGAIGLNMSYNSYSGYGLNATVSIQYGPYTLGSNFGTNGVGVNAGVGFAAGGGTLGVSGSIGLTGDGTFKGSVGVGYTTAAGVSVSASVGVSVNSGGDVAMTGSFGLTADNVHIGFSTEGVEASYNGVGIGAGPGGVSVSASYNGVGGTVNLSSRGFSAGISVQGTGLAVSAAGSNTSSKGNNTASIVVPGLFGYSRSTYQSWVRQASSEHSYGYMYQAGPALAVDGRNDDFSPVSVGGTNGNTGGAVPWDWSFKGRSLDHVGDPTHGTLMTGYDVFDVAAQGMNGAFRAMSLSKGEIYMSIEALGSVRATDAGEPDNNLAEDAAPNTLFYLMKPKTFGSGTSTSPHAYERQTTEDFDPAAGDPAHPQFTRFAYDYCHDNSESDPTNLHYLGNPSDASTRLNKVLAGECSRFAVLHSNYLNEGGRLLYTTQWDKNATLDFSKKYRNRMVFTFMGENGGYVESEDYPEGQPKKGRDDLSPAMMKKNLKNWKHASGTWNEPVLGVRKIEPILEGNSNIGRLQGFKITNPDGTQFFFNQPVRSLLTAGYTTNQPKGGPAFIDRHNPREDEDWTNILAEGWRNFTRKPIHSLVEVGRWGGKLVNGGISSFLFYSPNFSDACKPDDLTSTYNYSYSMSTNPYATQWLLTEVRGPDFVEFDPGHMEKNFGYQVKLHYTDVSHYAWRAPYAPPGMGNEELPNLRLPKNGVTADNCLSELYHASFGVKELVYLQSIETSTHEAVFHLNNIDPVGNLAAHPRVDAKGWIFDWHGGTVKVQNPAGGAALDHVREGIPIMVGTHFPVYKSAVGTPVVKTGFIHRADTTVFHNNTQVAYTFLQTLSWKSAQVHYSLKKVFLDIQPTPEQIAKMHGKTIVVTGYNSMATHAQLAMKPLPLPAVAAGYALLKAQVDPTHPTQPDFPVFPGYNVPQAPTASTDPSNPNLAPGTSFFATVHAIERATGEDLQYGSYAIIFENDVDLGNGELNTDFTVSGTTPITAYLANFDPATQTEPDVDPAVQLKLTSGGGDFKERSCQPLLVFDEFIDFNDEPGANQMRYLDSISIFDKRQMNTPLKRFVFSYKYDIQPNTLNSYELVDGSSDIFQKHDRSYPLQRDPDDPLLPWAPPGDPVPPGASSSLQGKLRLVSVQEVGCGGINCAERASLPPFRFSYQSPEMSPFKKADTRDETIRQSTESQDEWGLYNRFASEENNKARWYFADAGGAAWSLNKIIDPSGGIMEVQYERDTYMGESYAEDDLAVPVKWAPCDKTNPSSTMCLDFLPKKWVTYCDRNDRLKGEWFYTSSGTGQNMDYILQKGFVPGSQVFFNLQQTMVTDVGCGINVGFWKSGACARHRSVSEVGSGLIQTVTPLNIPDPLFDQAQYQGDVDNGQVDNSPCSRPSGCCENRKKYNPATHVYTTETLSKYWHCDYDVVRIKTDVPVTDLNAQFESTVNKLRKHDWSPADPNDNERFGVVWSRQTNRIIKGGDIRVKELVKRDIGLLQRSHYDYASGQTAQYADSAFSVAFATHLSTGKITDLLGTDVAALDKRFRDLPPQGRIPAIGDTDLAFLPAPMISYPKVTLTNVVVDNAGHKTVLNGKTEFEFHGPEQIGYLSFHIQNFTYSPNALPLDIFVEYWGRSSSSGAFAKLASFPRDKVEPVSLDNNPLSSSRNFTYGGARMDVPGGSQAKDILMLRFFVYQDMASLESNSPIIKDIYVKDAAAFGQLRAPKIDLYLKDGAINGTVLSLAKDLSKGLSGEQGAVYGDFEFQKPILVKTQSATNHTVDYEDYTSRLGKPKSTAFYRTVPDPAVPGSERYILVKKDTMIYDYKAPSVDTRFIPDADKAKVGVSKEKWAFERVRKCDSTNQTDDPKIPNCDDTETKSQWKPFGTQGLLARYDVTYTRYPSFLIASQSMSGFNASRQPEDAAAGYSDFIVSSVTNHYFDPVTGQPTLSVGYTGPLPASNVAGPPSKITRTTPAYVVDPDQETGDLPNLMFAKNMLEQKFREDVFTFPSGTVKTENDLNDAVLLPRSTGSGNTGNGDNGGGLAPYLTSIKLNPYQQKLVNQVDGVVRLEDDAAGTAAVTQPIVAMGGFAPRFDLTQANLKIPFNRDAFSVQPDLHVWNGSHITRVNRFFKALESEDVYHHSTASRFNAQGMHQIGLFGNSRYAESAVLLAEDQTDICSRPLSAMDAWTMGGPICPVVDGQFVLLAGNTHLSHSLDVQPNGHYLMEWQGQVKDALSVTVALESQSGNVIVQKTVSMAPGLGKYHATLDVPAGFTGSPPGTSTTRVSFGAQPVFPSTVKLKYLRAYPTQAQAVTYLYDGRGDMVQTVDVGNVSTYYEYDLMGKLSAIRNDDGVILSAGSREQTNK